jgi:hypothetical protein
MLEKVKQALRIKNMAYDYEIADLIFAAKADLSLGGVNKIADDDILILRAVILYCKANFGSNPDSEKYQKSYEMLKASLALAGDYNTPVSG